MNLREFFTTQTWWGKLIGGFFGYLSGGSIGALLGVLAGNLFDRGFANYYSNPHLLYHAEKQKTVQKKFFETTFSMLGHIAKADGRVSEQEINRAKQLMDEMKLSKEQKKLAKKLFNEGKQTTYNVNSALLDLKRACGHHRELLKLFIDIQYKAAQVDGLSAKKIKALDLVFCLLGFAPLHHQQRFYDDFNYSYAEQEENKKSQNHDSSSTEQKKKQSPKSKLDHAYALLEMSQDTSQQELKKAYRRLLSKNHPDKLIAKGLPQEMIKMANEKTQKIVKAYELICKSKGWS